MDRNFKEQIQEYDRKFTEIDKDNSGTITKDELYCYEDFFLSPEQIQEQIKNPKKYLEKNFRSFEYFLDKQNFKDWLENPKNVSLKIKTLNEVNTQTGHKYILDNLERSNPNNNDSFLKAKKNYEELKNKEMQAIELINIFKQRSNNNNYIKKKGNYIWDHKLFDEFNDDKNGDISKEEFFKFMYVSKNLQNVNDINKNNYKTQFDNNYKNYKNLSLSKPQPIQQPAKKTSVLPPVPTLNLSKISQPTSRPTSRGTSRPTSRATSRPTSRATLRTPRSIETPRDRKDKRDKRIEKKLRLVKSFNDNLEVFQEQYKKIKNILESYFKDNSHNNIDLSNFKKDFNEIINNNINKKNIIKNNLNNNYYCEKIINTKNNINNLKEDDKLDKSIKIFILLCYFINELNCILNQYDKELKDNYKKDKRFNDIKSIDYLQETLSNIIKQRNNINKNNENINSEFKINEEEMSEVCENINKILDKISEIFEGIYNDLDKKLVEEILRDTSGSYPSYMASTASSRISGTNKKAYETLKKEEDFNTESKFKYLATTKLNNNAKIINASEINNEQSIKLEEIINFYNILEKKKLNSNFGKAKQKILQTIRSKLVVYENKYPNQLPNYKFLDASVIYGNTSN